MEPVNPSTSRPRALRLTAIPVGVVLALVVFAGFGERSTPISEAQATAIAQLEQRLRNLEAERADQQEFATLHANLLRESLESQERELGALDGSIVLQRERAASADRIARRHAELLERQFVSQFDSDQKSAESRKQQVQLRKLSRVRAQLERDIKLHRQELATTQINARERIYDIQRETLALLQERGEQGRHDDPSSAILYANANLALERHRLIAIEPVQSVTTRM